MTGKPTFETIVAAHGPTVLRVCRAVVGAGDSDDAWSETFLSAMRAYPDLPADANVEAWLVTIAHRKAIDLTRRAARNPVPVAALPESPSIVDDDEIGDGTELVVALDQLPPKQKQAVAYHYLAGLPYIEVAAIIGGNRVPPDAQPQTESPTSGARLPISRQRKDYPMNTETQLTAALARSLDDTPDHLSMLHDRLAAAAQAEGVLDVAYRTIDTHVGSLLLAATDRGLVRVAYAIEDHDAVLQTLADRISPRILSSAKRLDDVARELDEYFEGRRRTFDVTLDWRLSKGFRSAVLHALPGIGYGHTASYADVARLAGSPNAVRAVGSACATNPLPIVVPCHRVVRSDGALGGYLGGAEAKRTLLGLEAAA